MSRARRQPLRLGLLAALAALAALAGGCSSEAESFALRLVWNQDGAQACPRGEGDEGASCATIPLSCDARVLIRIVPAHGGAPYYSQCYLLRGERDACALRDLDIRPSQPIPNTMVRVQVAVWSEDQLAPLGEDLAPDACPDTVLYDDFGMPRINVEPVQQAVVPALGGEIYFPVGDRRVAEVELGCPRHDLLDLEACRVGAPRIEATIRDPLTSASVSVEVGNALDVRFGAPTADGAGGWSLISNDLEMLEQSVGGELVWTRRLEREVPALGCLEVDHSEPRSTPVAICRDTAVVDGTLRVEGYVVRKALVDLILDALVLDDFPTTGVVLGIVVDHHNNRVEGARVLTSEGSIAYPTADFQHVGLDSTSSSGMFLSTSARFGSVWRATHPSGVGDDGTARGGLITDHLSVVVIRLNAPIGGKLAP